MDKLTEQDLFNWMLANRILHELGELDAHRVAKLDALDPNWFFPVTEEEYGHALVQYDEYLDFAIEAWFNDGADGYVTADQLRAEAKAEGLIAPGPAGCRA
jgi:hypothetical protein